MRSKVQVVASKHLDPLLSGFSGVYGMLRALARRQLRRGGGNTLNTTALVHETWLKLASSEKRVFDNRNHFVAVASTAMRHILVDHARRRHSKKRSREAPDTGSALSTVGVITSIDEILSVDAALTKLQALDERLARVVEWRFFGGLEEAEIALALDVDVRTVRRDWRKARAFILGELSEI